MILLLVVPTLILLVAWLCTRNSSTSSADAYYHARLEELHQQHLQHLKDQAAEAWLVERGLLKR